MTAKELQDKKTKAEIKIMKILERLNKICVKNDFQVENITLMTTNYDDARTFDIDIPFIYLTTKNTNRKAMIPKGIEEKIKLDAKSSVNESIPFMQSAIEAAISHGYSLAQQSIQHEAKNEAILFAKWISDNGLHPPAISIEQLYAHFINPDNRLDDVLEHYH